MVIGKTMRGTTYFASVLFNSAIYKYAKKRGLWYYRLLLSQQFIFNYLFILKLFTVFT